MEKDNIFKKKGVQLVRKRLKELLKPLGFQQHPRSTNRFVRVRDNFIDEVRLDTAGTHLEPWYFIHYRFAPFAGLKCDRGRLWRTAKENISTHLSWHCEIPLDGGHYYYKPDHFEMVWKDVAYVLGHYILPLMDEMTVEKFLSLLVVYSPYERDLFRANEIVRFTDPHFVCMSEAAVYGMGMWCIEQYDEGVPYLTFAQFKYRRWMVGREQETDFFYQCDALTLELLNELVSFWTKKEKNWTSAAQERMRQTGVDWADYLP